MRTYLLIAALAVVMFCTPDALAGKKKKKKGGGGAAMGMIMSLPDKTIVYDVPQEGKPGKRYISYVGDHTVITIDGKPATHRDLAVGMLVSIKGGKVAKTVAATTVPRKNW